ncbi:MAG: heavy metal-associated domain-containing protein [Planctomycetota bacterium]|nr:heavy metal-associated domain-containing protein [Planctomycetota bacterium]
MNESNNATRTLEIDGMSGDVCVKKVTDALKAVPNVKTESVKVGSAVISADQHGCSAACSGIDAAGFHARESAASKAASAAKHPAGAAPMAPKADSHQPAGAPPIAHKSDSQHPAAANMPKPNTQPQFNKKPEQGPMGSPAKVAQPAK